MNTIESILNDIDELLEDSWSLPLSGGRCVVDAEKVRDLIDSIRMNMPAEIKQARAVVADRNQILSLAKGEAEALIRKAEERAKQLLGQGVTVKDTLPQGHGPAERRQHPCPTAGGGCPKAGRADGE